MFCSFISLINIDNFEFFVDIVKDSGQLLVGIQHYSYRTCMTNPVKFDMHKSFHIVSILRTFIMLKVLFQNIMSCNYIYFFLDTINKINQHVTERERERERKRERERERERV